MQLGREDFEALLNHSAPLRQALMALDGARLVASIRATPGDERRWAQTWLKATDAALIGATFTGLAGIELAFLVATFLANLPESMASADTMGRAGYTPTRILALWGSLVLLALVMAALGNLLLATAPPQVVGLAEAVAGGAILALVAQVMMPHAFEGGGRYVSLSTIGGFLVGFLLSTVNLE